MPSVNDIVGIAESLQKSPVYVDRDRCVAVRNRNATCRKCVDACIVGAISIEQNQITLSANECMACGACTTVCPTEALVALKPTEGQMVAAAQKASEPDGRVVYACARISSKHLADPERFVEVPCIARVDEAAILPLVAQGASSVLLVDGHCKTCKYRDCVPGMNAAVESANQLMAAQGCGVRVVRTSAFPDDMLLDETQNKFGSTRRGFFSDTVSAARDITMTAAKTAIEQELGVPAESDIEIGQRLRADSHGNLPQFEAKHHNDVVNAMYDLGDPVVDSIDTRVFGSVEVDAQKCNGCGMCAVFCPTCAMRRDERKKPYTNPEYLEFDAALCTQCGMCVDVCWKKAITLSSVVSLSQLFDFEPRRFDLSQEKGPRTGVKRLFS